MYASSPGGGTMLILHIDDLTKVAFYQFSSSV